MGQVLDSWHASGVGDEVEPALPGVCQRRNEQARHTDLHRDPVAGGPVPDHEGLPGRSTQEHEHQFENSGIGLLDAALTGQHKPSDVLVQPCPAECRPDVDVDVARFCLSGIDTKPASASERVAEACCRSVLLAGDRQAVGGVAPSQARQRPAWDQ